MIRGRLLVVILLILISPAVLARPVDITLTEMYRTTGGGCCPNVKIDFGMEKNFSEVNFQALIAHHHNGGNSLSFNLSHANGSTAYMASWVYWAVYAVVEDTISLENTIASTFLYRGYIGSRSPGFGWLEARMVPIKFRRTITHEDGIVDFGFVDDLTDASDASNFFRVSSIGPGVLVWLGEDDADPTTTTTDNSADSVLACLDTNLNDICDVSEATYQACIDDVDGDWYAGQCCGSNFTGCEFVGTLQMGTKQECTTTPPQFFWQQPIVTCVTVDNNVSVDAICGKNTDDEWEWVGLAEFGEIHEMNCPDASIVPDGVDFNSCGEEFGGLLAVFDSFKNLTFAGFTHEYSCENQFVEECTGEDDAYSQINWFGTGTVSSRSDDTYYCASDGDWTTDLDIKDKISCESALFSWTGSLCCSEADDPGEYYNDLFAGHIGGGCWNEVFVPSGDFVEEFGDEQRDMINFNGSFYGCHIPQTDSRLGILDYHTDTFLVDNSVEYCGYILYDAQPGAFPHAVCHTDGIWRFTDNPGGTIEKNIGWSAIIDISEMEKEEITGCCANNQCYNGSVCRPVGAFYRVDDVGFECQMPDTVELTPLEQIDQIFGEPEPVAPEENAFWAEVPIKYSWDLSMANICPEDSQCLLHIQGDNAFNGDGERKLRLSDPTLWPKCMNDSQNILDFRCEYGNWTTRTKHIGVQLLDYAQDNSQSDFTVFCGYYEDVLNQYRYFLPQNLFVEDFLRNNCPNPGGLIPCINNMCVVKTPSEIGVGASLNVEIDNPQHSFLKALGKNVNLCDNVADDATEFISCGGNVWYNPELNAVIYLSGGSLSAPDVTDSLESIIAEDFTPYVMDTLHDSENPGLDFDYFPKTRLFNHIYFAKKGDVEIFGFLEPNIIPEFNPIPLDYIGVVYDAELLGTSEITCRDLIKVYDSEAFCEEQTGLFKIIARHRDVPSGQGASPIVRVWPALTGKLRP